MYRRGEPGRKGRRERDVDPTLSDSCSLNVAMFSSLFTYSPKILSLRLSHTACPRKNAPLSIMV